MKVNFTELTQNQPDSDKFNSQADNRELNIKEEEAKDDIIIRVDLSFESTGGNGYNMVHVGYRTTEFVNNMLKKYQSLYTVTMTLKEFLNNRNMLNIYQGKILPYNMFNKIY